MYALGSFNDEDTRDYDNYVTLVRTGIVGVNLFVPFSL